jgi:hypothetical protein
MAKHIRTKGDTRKPLTTRLMTRIGNPEDLSSVSVKFKMVAKDDTVIVALTTDNVTIHPTKAFTATASTDRLTANGHGIQDGWQVVLATSGTLPGGLAAATRYYVTQATLNDFKLSLLPNGTPVDVTDAGTGSHTLYVVGHVQYKFQADDVATAGIFYGWFQIVDATETDTFPDDGRNFEIEIVEAG